MSKDTNYKREQDYWDRRGEEEYISLSATDQKRLVERIKWQGYGKVLDLGGGSGMISRLIADSPETVCVCLDISYNLLKFSPVPSVQADAFGLPFGDNSFDLIVAAAFLHHIPGREVELLEECSRVLVPGGVIVGYDPNGHCIQNKIFMSDGPFRLQFFSPDERPIMPENMQKYTAGASFKDFESFLFTFRNPKITVFEFIQRYILNFFAVGFLKKYLDRWFFWRAYN